MGKDCRSNSRPGSDDEEDANNRITNKSGRPQRALGEPSEPEASDAAGSRTPKARVRKIPQGSEGDANLTVNLAASVIVTPPPEPLPARKLIPATAHEREESL